MNYQQMRLEDMRIKMRKFQTEVTMQNLVREMKNSLEVFSRIKAAEHSISKLENELHNTSIEYKMLKRILK